MKFINGDFDDIGINKLERIIKLISPISLDQDFYLDIYQIFYSEKPSLISPIAVPSNFMNRYLIESYLLLSTKWTRLLTKGYRERSIITSSIVIDEILNWLNPKIDEHKQILNELIGKGGKEVSNETLKRLIDNVTISLERRISNTDLILYVVRALSENDSLDPFSELLVIRFMNKIVDYPEILAEIIKLSRDNELREIIVEKIEAGTLNYSAPLDKAIDIIKKLKEVEE